MPTVHYENGFRFFFYSNENGEPVHVHISKGDAIGKVWLEPEIELAYTKGFTMAESKMFMNIISENVEAFKNRWNEHFA